MKNNFTSMLKETIELGKKYVRLQIDVAKLTTVEKLTMLLGGITLGLVAVLCMGFVLLLLAFAAADLLKNIMSAALAYLATAGIVVAVMMLIFALRKQIIINPIARMVSKLFFQEHPNTTPKQ